MARIQEAEFGFSSLDSLDEGMIAEVLKKHMNAISQDVMNRPHEKTKRKILLEFTFEPVLNRKDGSCDKVNVEVEVKSKVPVMRSNVFEMRPVRGGFLFNKDFPSELDQPPLPGTERD